MLPEFPASELPLTPAAVVPLPLPAAGALVPAAPPLIPEPALGVDDLGVDPPAPLGAAGLPSPAPLAPLGFMLLSLVEHAAQASVIPHVSSLARWSTLMGRTVARKAAATISGI